MYTLTVYTPTYNRAHLLPRLYGSLCRQTCRDFLWMVIDDGSTDNTMDLIKAWIEESKLEIEYHYKPNGGVHTARDMAYHLSQTELILSVDSDDWITNDAIEMILAYWSKYGGDNYAGIFIPVCTPDGSYYGKRFPNLLAANYQEFTYKYNIHNEKLTVLRSDIIKRIPNYPVFEGEKLVGEGYKWIQLPIDMPFLILDKPLRVYDIQPDGIVATARRNIFTNPRGFREASKKAIIHSKYLAPRLKGQVRYILYSLYLKDKKLIRNSPKPFVTCLMLPLGMAAYWYAKWNWGKMKVNGKTN